MRDNGRKIDACPGKGTASEIRCHSKGFFAAGKDRPFTRMKEQRFPAVLIHSKGISTGFGEKHRPLIAAHEFGELSTHTDLERRPDAMKMYIARVLTCKQFRHF